MTRISVIIPVCNAAPYLRACLGSVLGQTLRDIEVICVDDGSTDGSAAILTACAADDPRLKVLTQPNGGQGAARNRGLEVATGEYVCFVDADDAMAATDALERLAAEAARERLDALFFDAETRIDEGVAVSSAVVRADDYIRRHDYSAAVAGRELFARFLRNREYTVSPCLVLLRRAFLAAAGVRFPDERIFYEDNIFMTHVLLAAHRASHRPWRLYLRKVHAGSTVTSPPTMRHLRGYLACLHDVETTLSRGGWDRATAAALRDRRAVYRLHIRRLADADPELVAAALGEMPAAERAALQEVLAYPLGERIANAFRCLRDRGLAYTIRRILFGRQPD